MGFFTKKKKEKEGEDNDDFLTESQKRRNILISRLSFDSIDKIHKTKTSNTKKNILLKNRRSKNLSNLLSSRYVKTKEDKTGWRKESSLFANKNSSKSISIGFSGKPENKKDNDPLNLHNNLNNNSNPTPSNGSNISKPKLNF